MLHGIIDPQPGKLVFALFDGMNLIHRAEAIMQPRDASGIPDFIASELAKLNYALNDVNFWTFGAGPGSFTFLRVAAALGAGWAAGNSKISFRCLPGALAFARALQVAEGEKVGVIYDGRNKELLCFVVAMQEGKLVPTGEELILDSAGAKKYFSGNPMRLAANAKDAPALQMLLENSVEFTVVEPDLTVFAAYDAPFDNDADKMIYIRPAVSGKA